MGMSNKNGVVLTPPTQVILNALDEAEKLSWANLELIARKGDVASVREATVSLALIRAFQTSLGTLQEDGPTLAAGLLGKFIQTMRSNIEF